MEDINITTRIKATGKILGIELLDHIIIIGSEKRSAHLPLCLKIIFLAPSSEERQLD